MVVDFSGFQEFHGLSTLLLVVVVVMVVMIVVMAVVVVIVVMAVMAVVVVVVVVVVGGGGGGDGGDGGDSWVLTPADTTLLQLLMLLPVCWWYATNPLFGPKPYFMPRRPHPEPDLGVSPHCCLGFRV